MKKEFEKSWVLLGLVLILPLVFALIVIHRLSPEKWSIET